MDLDFRNIDELYKRIMPALTTKKRELIRLEFSTDVVEEDIWNFLRESKWTKSSGLDLNDMVTDILNVDVVLLKDYIKKKI